MKKHSKKSSSKRAVSLSASLFGLAALFGLFQNAVTAKDSVKVFFPDVSSRGDLLLLNTGDADIRVRARIVSDDPNDATESWIDVPALERRQVSLSEVSNARDGSFSLELSAPTLSAATTESAGIDLLSSRWEFAEGGDFRRGENGAPLYENWYSVLNPNDYEITVSLDLLSSGKVRPPILFNVPARGRARVNPANSLATESGHEIETSRTSAAVACIKTYSSENVPCAVQFTMFEQNDSKSRTLVHSGATTTATRWVVTDRSSEVVISNNNAKPTEITVLYRNADGVELPAKQLQTSLAPYSRNVFSVKSSQTSLEIRASQPISLEQRTARAELALLNGDNSLGQSSSATITNTSTGPTAIWMTVFTRQGRIIHRKHLGMLAAMATWKLDMAGRWAELELLEGHRGPFSVIFQAEKPIIGRLN
jgi:hypothetical protein